MSLHKTLLACCAITLLSACSLVKLSDKVSQANCKSDSDCDVLNDRKAVTFNPCNLWQCSDTKYCELGALDSDHDGFTPATITVKGEDVMCEDDPAKQDCDDDNDARLPGKKEACDSLDNDCDGNIDEGVLMPKSGDAVVFAAPNPDGVSDTSFAVDPDSNTLALAYSITHDPNHVPGLTLIADGLPPGGLPGDIELPDASLSLLADGVGVGALGGQKFAVAFYQRSGVRRLVAGLISGKSAPFKLLASSDMLTYGLRCGADEKACADNAKSPTTALATPDTETPSLAAIDGDVLVAYARNTTSDDPEACPAANADVSTHEVLANLLGTDGDGNLAEQSKAALLLGTSDSPSAPAVLGLPKLPVGATMQAFGWLVGYPDKDGAITLQRVTRDGNANLSVGDSLATIGQGKGTRYKDVHLALGALTDAGQQVGVVYQIGCSTTARIAFSLFTVKLKTNGDAELTNVVSDVQVGGGATESHPSVVFSKDHNSWGVAYRDPKGLRARVIDATGKVLGTTPYVLVDNVTTGSAMLRVNLSPAIVTLGTDTGWFGALIYADRGTDHVFESATLSSCQKKP